MEELIVRPTISTTWIENLALEELNMDESGIVNFDEHLDPSFSLEESSIRYVDELRDLFEVYASRFNECRGHSSGNNVIKIFKISNTVNDFMLFRNSLRLIVARRAHDLISVGFLGNGGKLFGARLQSQGENSPAHEIKAHIGPFNDIRWKYAGETVDKNSMVKHYLSEFIKRSAR